MALPSGAIQFRIIDELARSATVEAYIGTNQFEHLAATLDGETGQMRLYVNGQLFRETLTSIGRSPNSIRHRIPASESAITVDSPILRIITHSRGASTSYGCTRVHFRMGKSARSLPDQPQIFLSIQRSHLPPGRSPDGDSFIGPVTQTPRILRLACG